MQVNNGRLNRNIAWDRQQGFQVTDNKGYAANGNRYLGDNVRQNKVDNGNQMSRYTAADASHKAASQQAHRSYNHAYKKAWSDGNISKAEQRGLKGLRRDKNVAHKQVKQDSMRRTYGRSLSHAAQNGRITPGERQKLQEQRHNLNDMKSTVSSLKTRDAGLDRRDQAVRNSGQGILEHFQSAELHNRNHGKVF